MKATPKGRGLPGFSWTRGELHAQIVTAVGKLGAEEGA